MIPYTPEMHHIAGTYRLEVGSLFYIGSTRKIGRRFSNHRILLRDRGHWIKELQAEFDRGGEVRMFLLREIPKKPCDEGNDHRDRLQMHEQVLLEPLFGTPGCVNRSSSSGYHSGMAEVMRKRWADPEWRASTGAKISAAAAGRVVGEETRRRMADSKRGKKNAKSRPVVMFFGGARLRFESASLAAVHFGVSQQAMDLWLRAVVPWPGLGVRKPRQVHLIGLTGCYEDALGEVEDYG